MMSIRKPVWLVSLLALFGFLTLISVRYYKEIISVGYENAADVADDHLPLKLQYRADVMQILSIQKKKSFRFTLQREAS